MTFFISRPQRALAALTVMLSASLVQPLSAAAETIALSSEDQARLGIVSQPLVAADSGVGIHVPAVIIPSPESPSQLVARYDGVLVALQRAFLSYGLQFLNVGLLAAVVLG